MEPWKSASLGWALALLANITFSWKSLQGTSNLAYYAQFKVMKKDMKCCEYNA